MTRAPAVGTGGGSGARAGVPRRRLWSWGLSLQWSSGVKAVRRVSNGLRYVSASLPASLAEELKNPRDSAKLPHEELSMRELQIFTRLGRGMTVGCIAAELKLNAKTVSTYRSRVLEKMNFMSNSAIAAYAKKNRLMM